MWHVELYLIQQGDRRNVVFVRERPHTPEAVLAVTRREFVNLCANESQHAQVCQLHQWLLWHAEMGIELPDVTLEMRERALAAFESTVPTPSFFQVASPPTPHHVFCFPAFVFLLSIF